MGHNNNRRSLMDLLLLIEIHSTKPNHFESALIARRMAYDFCRDLHPEKKNATNKDPKSHGHNLG